MCSASRRVDLAALGQRDVLDRAGRPLGRIGELHIDMNDGRVEYATLRLRDAPSPGARTLVIPWSQFGIAGDGQHLQLGISREVLETVAARHPGGCS